MKQTTAMIGVKNEEGFLSSSVHSISDLVDEILIVDNDGTDIAAVIALNVSAGLPLEQHWLDVQDSYSLRLV